MSVKDESRSKDLRLLGDFVTDGFGIAVDEDRYAAIAGWVDRRLVGLGLTGVPDYVAFLKYSPERAEELRKLVSYLTNKETYFFREESLLDVFFATILPALHVNKRRDGEKSLKIVSAGCSSGEEVYTLAMQVQESGLFGREWHVRIIGLDVDAEALAKAQLALYQRRAVRAVPKHLLHRHFRQMGEIFQVRDTVREITAFRQGNLLDISEYFPDQSIDVIFCRNVLMYFADDMARKAVGGFYTVLRPNGYLCLGHSESLARIGGEFVPLRLAGGVVYRPLEETERKRSGDPRQPAGEESNRIVR